MTTNLRKAPRGSLLYFATIFLVLPITGSFGGKNANHFLVAAQEVAPRLEERKQQTTDWPIFRGNALQTGVSGSSLPDRLEVLWTVKTKDSIEASAAIVASTVYIGSMDQSFLALELSSGKEKWRFKAGPFKAPPSVRQEFVYVGDGDGKFHCLEAATGKERWSFTTEGEISSGANFTDKSLLFGSGDETLYCLALDGKERWRFKVAGGPILASPSIVGDRTFVGGCDSLLHVVDTDQGKEQSSVELNGQTAATAAIDGDLLYLGTMTNQVLCIDWKKSKVLWTYESPRIKREFFSSSALSADLVVIGSRDKKVHALDRTSGKQVWNFPTRGKVDSSPVIVGKRVYVGSVDSHLYVLDLATGKELQSIKLDGEVIASPAVGGNCLVVGTSAGTVYCFGAKK